MHSRPTHARSWSWSAPKRSALRGSVLALAVLAVLAGAQPAFAQSARAIDLQTGAKAWRCGTPAQLPLLADKPRAVVPAFFMADELDGLVERDSFGAMESMTSDHFSLKWGEPGAVDEAHLAAVLEALELSWKQYVEILEHRHPTGAEVYFVNAYIGSTGGVSPEIDFSGGYATIDDDGFPYLVLSSDMLGDSSAAEVAAHEFYHVVQMSTDAFQYEYDAYWYWEATAEWAMQEVYPDGDIVYNPIGAYALAPQVSLDYFSDPFAESLLAMHQYGAFIFPRFITERITSPSIIRDSWEIGGPEDMPLEVLDMLLGAADTSVDEVFAQFAAHNAGWDYAKRQVFLWLIDYYEEYYPEENTSIADTVAPGGTDGWVEAPAATEPWAYGYNVIKLANPQSGDYVVAFEGDEQGSSGTAGVYRGTVVRESSLGFEYLPIPIEGRGGEVVVEDVHGEMALYLVVTAQPQTRREQETFGFRYRIEIGAQTPFPPAALPAPTYPGFTDAPTVGDGGGCATSNPSASLLLAMLLIVPLVHRRRRRRV